MKNKNRSDRDGALVPHTLRSPDMASALKETPNGFKIVRIVLDAGASSAPELKKKKGKAEEAEEQAVHFAYVREHKVRKEDARLPSGKTLFVLNPPLDAVVS